MARPYFTAQVQFGRRVVFSWYRPTPRPTTRSPHPVCRVRVPELAHAPTSRLKPALGGLCFVSRSALRPPSMRKNALARARWRPAAALPQPAAQVRARSACTAVAARRGARRGGSELRPRLRRRRLNHPRDRRSHRPAEHGARPCRAPCSGGRDTRDAGHPPQPSWRRTRPRTGLVSGRRRPSESWEAWLCGGKSGARAFWHPTDAAWSRDLVTVRA